MHVLCDPYSNRCKQIPIVLVLGVATSATTIFQTLSVNETTRIKLSVFTSQTSNESLNTIIEEILLSPVVPFLLSGKVLKLLKNIFLYYDFTTTVFLKGYKYCMLEHYSQGNAFSVCTSSLSRSVLHKSTFGIRNFNKNILFDNIFQINGANRWSHTRRS